MSNNPTTMRPCRMCASCNLGTYQIKADMLANADKIVVCRDCKFEQSITKWNTRPIEDQLQAQVSKSKETIQKLHGLLCETCTHAIPTTMANLLKEGDAVCIECCEDRGCNWRRYHG